MSPRVGLEHIPGKIARVVYRWSRAVATLFPGQDIKPTKAAVPVRPLEFHRSPPGLAGTKVAFHTIPVPFRDTENLGLYTAVQSAPFSAGVPYALGSPIAQAQPCSVSGPPILPLSRRSRSFARRSESFPYWL